MVYDALNADQRGGIGPNGKNSLTIDEAAAQITRMGHSWSADLGTATTVTYAFRASAPSIMPENTGGFSQFTSDQIQQTQVALSLWAGVANIQFVQVSPGGYSNNATILFGNYATGEQDAAAFTILPGNRAVSSSTGDVWVNSSDSDKLYALASGSEGFDTLLHEIGHAIGLSHPSNYDVGSSTDITYHADASYFEDSGEYSLMSYFAASVTGASIGDYQGRPGGPLIDDIAAAQRLYGANYATNAGDTVYGPSTGPNSFTDYLHKDGSLWGSIWDGGGNDTIDLSSKSGPQTINLNQGSFTTIGSDVGGLSIAQGTVIENAKAGPYDDVLIGNSADNVLDGGAGSDRLIGGLGGDTYIGGAGDDRAVLNGNVGDYLLVSGGDTLLLMARNGSGDEAIDGSIETVEFRNGQYLSTGDLSAYVQSVATAGNDRIVAPATLYVDSVRFDGGAGDDRLVLGGNTWDYTLSRGAEGVGTGDFVLTARNGSGTYRISEGTETVEFRNGQYLSLKDVPSYVAGDASLRDGGAQDDLLYQTGDGQQHFSGGGGGGSDTLYLRGNVEDYSGHAAVLLSVAPYSTSPAAQSGYQLDAINGSGSIFIENDIEKIVFQNGTERDFGSLPAAIAFNPTIPGATMITLEAGDFSYYYIAGTSGLDTLFFDRPASDYVLSRDPGTGDFRLGHAVYNDNPRSPVYGDNNSYSIGSGVETVAFADGRYLSLSDLRFFMPGNATFTKGTPGDDILIPDPLAENQTLLGADGFDRAYLDHNVGDYSLQYIQGQSMASGQFTGYQLIGQNGAPTINIDNSVEEVHFANGQYLAFADLPAYIHNYG